MRVQLIELITNFARIIISKDQKNVFIKYIMEAVSHFGRTEKFKFENFCYAHHHLMQFMSTNTFLRNYNKLFIESKKLIQRKKFDFLQINKKRDGSFAFYVLEPSEGFHLSMEKAKSSYSKTKNFLFDEESAHNKSRSSSISSKSTRVKHPFSMNKFKSVDDDWLERSEPKLLNNKILKLSRFSKMTSTHSMPDKKIITIDEKLKKSKDIHERRNMSRRGRKLKKTSSKEQLRESLFTNKIDQKLENKPLPEDQSSRLYKRQLLKNNEKILDFEYNPEDNFAKRTIEPERGHEKHSYFVFPMSSCKECQKEFSAEDTKQTIQSIAVLLEKNKDRSF